MKLEFERIQRKKVHCVGLSIETSFEQAEQDGRRLWQEMNVVLSQFNAEYMLANAIGNTYGLSLPTSDSTLTYCVAIDNKALESKPAELKKIIVAAGDYLKVKCRDVDQVAEIYKTLFYCWDDHVRDCRRVTDKACFELYQMHWQPNDPFELFIPVTDDK